LQGEDVEFRSPSVYHTWRDGLPTALTLLLLCGGLFADNELAITQSDAGPNALLSEHQYCLENLPEEIHLPPVNLGCSVIDCCPGCPVLDAPWELGGTLVINRDGQMADRIDLRILNREAAEVQRLLLENADHVGNSTIRLGPGKASITAPAGFTGSLLLAPWFEVPEGSGGAPPWTTAGLDLDLYVLSHEGALLSALGYKLSVVPCGPDEPPPTPASCRESIELVDNDGNDSALVLLDARSEYGCLDDVLLRGPDVIHVGNVMSPLDCRNEIMVLSREDGVKVLDHAQSASWSVWKDTLPDNQPVELDLGPVKLPLRVVIAMSDGTGDARREDAEKYVIEAETLLDTHFAGISVENTAEYVILPAGDPRITVVKEQASAAPAGEPPPSCEDLHQMVGALENAGVYDGNMLNVYFVDAGFTGAHFRYCADKGYLSTQMIFVGTYASGTTLIHEIGHALNLGHVHSSDDNHDDEDDFSSKNIMWPAAQNRDQFTAGQVVRCSLEERSLLNSGGFRSGQPTRHCKRQQMSAECPWRALGVFTP
jgi:hypothetical protein